MPYSDPDALLTAAQHGDRLALETLLATHRASVFRYGLRYCKTSEDAEDAVQETLWAVARSIGGFRRAAAITTWLFAIVRNKCHKLNSLTQPDTDLADILPRIPDEADPIEQQVAQRQIEGVLAFALSKMEPIYREALMLRDVEGLTAPEAAERLSIGIPALKSRLHRGRRVLREIVRSLHPLH